MKNVTASSRLPIQTLTEINQTSNYWQICCEDRAEATSSATFGYFGLSKMRNTEQKDWSINGLILYNSTVSRWDLVAKNQTIGVREDKIWLSGRFNANSTFCNSLPTIKIKTKCQKTFFLEQIVLYKWKAFEWDVQGRNYAVL